MPRSRRARTGRRPAPGGCGRGRGACRPDQRARRRSARRPPPALCAPRPARPRASARIQPLIAASPRWGSFEHMIGAIILGFVAGVIGRALMPGDVFRHMSGPASWATSLVLGLVGAIVGWLIFTRLIGI